MTVTRTIEIYEYIPLQELRDELDEDEVLLVESINRFVKGIRDMHGGLHKYSWDEVLRYSCADDDFENLQRYVMSDFKERRNIPDYLWNFRGLGFGFGLPTTSQAPATEVSGSTLQNLVREKLDDLIADPRLKPASYDALHYWSVCGIQKETITNMNETITNMNETITNMNETITNMNETITNMNEISRLKTELDKARVDEHLVYKVVATSVRTALERSVAEKGDTAAKMQDWAIRDVIRDNGFDWKTFECGKDTLTVERLHQACQELKPNLFRMGRDTFRTQAWQGFRARRKHKLDANISIASLKLRVEPDKP